jgi:predicted amidophosphoribosyltransferase
MATAAGVVPDVVTWVPTTAARRGRRGVDQARLLARSAGRGLRRGGGRSAPRVPVRRLLLRAPDTGQTGRTGRQRRRGPVLRARAGVVPAGSTILLVDDVVTTGASMDAAVAALRDAGAGRVVPVAVARTPRATQRR